MCIKLLPSFLVPSAPPQEVRAINKTTNSILITWYEVPVNQQNGRILSYNVTYTMIKQKITETKQVEVPKIYLNLTGVQANTNYSITVMASTIKGHGPASQAVYVITGQHGKSLDGKMRPLKAGISLNLNEIFILRF